MNRPDRDAFRQAETRANLPPMRLDPPDGSSRDPVMVAAAEAAQERVAAEKLDPADHIGVEPDGTLRVVDPDLDPDCVGTVAELIEDFGAPAPGRPPPSE